MCTKDRRIESRSVCLTEPNQNSHKKFLRNSSPTNLECKPRGYNDRNVRKAGNICRFLQYELFKV